ncbi:MAG: hypothetical protein ACYDGN_16935 [Acidimicrobiales bacterium]
MDHNSSSGSLRLLCSCPRGISGFVSWFDLVPDVPEQTRNAFERLRSVHTYGVLNYDLFTVAGDLAFLVFEQALGKRFVAFYGGEIPVVDKSGGAGVISARTFGDVREALRRGGTHSRGGWRLQLRSDELINFRPTLDHSLFTWARREGLLPGQRVRHLHRLLAKMRHAIAHPSGFHIKMPNQSARTIADLGALRNQLWGHPTPGSRFFPGRRVRRVVRALAWDDEGSLYGLAPENLVSVPDGDGLSYLLVLAGSDDMDAHWDLFNYDARFEATSLPCDYLWGPATWKDAAAWLNQFRPAADEVAYLDRPFVVRTSGDAVDLPRRPTVGASMSDESADRWFLVCADYPSDAFVHVRNLVQLPGGECATTGECPVCAVTTWASGSLAVVIHEAAARGIDVTPETPPDVRVPSRW